MKEPVRGPKDFLRIVATGALALIIGGLTILGVSHVLGFLEARIQAIAILVALVWAFWDTAEWVLGKRRK